MRKKVKQIVISVMLLFAMSVSIMPANVFADAASQTEITLKVGGKTIKDGTKDRKVFGGKISFKEGILTLNNVNVSEAKTGIYIKGDSSLNQKIKIVFSGTNTISATTYQGIRVDRIQECTVENNGTTIIEGQDSCIMSVSSDLCFSGNGKLKLSSKIHGITQEACDQKNHNITFESGDIDFDVKCVGIRVNASEFWNEKKAYEYTNGINFAGANCNINVTNKAENSDIDWAYAIVFTGDTAKIPHHGIVNISGGKVEISAKSHNSARMNVLSVWDDNGAKVDATVNVSEFKYPVIKTGTDGASAQKVNSLTLDDFSKSYISITPTYVKVKLDANGGYIGKKSVKSKTLTLAKGYSYGNLEVPKRKGYKFQGWYTKKTGGKKVTVGAAVTSSTTLYARWKRSK